MRKRASSWRSAALPLAVAVLGSCYSTDRGITPPFAAPYYPVGLATSPGGRTLYVANSDFDLQYDSGTLESYDLAQLRRDAVALLRDPRALTSRCINPTHPDCPYDSATYPFEDRPRCADAPGDTRTIPPTPGAAVGNTCTPPLKPSVYHKSSVRIGAFATDLQLSQNGFRRDGAAKRRLFAPIRGNASVTWIDVADDARDPGADSSVLDCGALAVSPTCDVLHQAGNRADETGNTRSIVMPGEPFGLAQSIDGTFLAVTHQSSAQTSLLSTGLPGADQPDADAIAPSLQFVTTNVPVGGNGIAAIPYDPDSVVDPSEDPRPGFLLTSRAAAQLTLLRVFSDQGIDGSQGRSTLTRPYLVPEASFPVDATANGIDSRDIVVDPTNRVVCKNRLPAGASEAERRACARLPLDVYVANRSPDSILVAELGERTDTIAGSYAANVLTFKGAIPVPAGASRLKLAPVVDVDGALVLRLFVVCFGSSAVLVYDPANKQLDRVLRVGRGPFALAFDPFDLEAAIRHDQVPRDADGNLTYRFAYLSSFTESYVQMIDLDRTSPAYEHPVLTLGVPTPPKSEQK